MKREKMRAKQQTLKQKMAHKAGTDEKEKTAREGTRAQEAQARRGGDRAKSGKVLRLQLKSENRSRSQKVVSS